MQKWDIKSCGAGALSAVLQHHGDPISMDGVGREAAEDARRSDVDRPRARGARARLRREPRHRRRRTRRRGGARGPAGDPHAAGDPGAGQGLRLLPLHRHRRPRPGEESLPHAVRRREVALGAPRADRAGVEADEVRDGRDPPRAIRTRRRCAPRCSWRRKASTRSPRRRYREILAAATRNRSSPGRTSATPKCASDAAARPRRRSARRWRSSPMPRIR